MASISSAIICDFAQVREGLLFVMSGGITRVLRPELPGTLGVKAAVVVEIGPEEIDQQHHVVVAVKHPASAQELARVGTTFQAGGALEPGESLYVPLVVDLAAVIATEYGAHDVQVAVDGGVPTQLTIYLAPAKPRQRPHPA